MSTYARERPAWLGQALESIYGQTRPVDQMVLVVDGPVSAELEAVIAQYQRDGRVGKFDLVRQPTNQGLAKALNAGLERCTGEWIMRMDSDDVSRSDRLAIQLGYLRDHPDIDILTSWIEEFADDDRSVRLKTSPVEHAAVIDALRWRNILGHPSALVRAAALRRIGGYRATFDKLEDYDLYVRLALDGACFHVLPAFLVRMRAGIQQSVRRGGWRHFRQDLRFRTFCFRRGFLSGYQYLVSTALYAGLRLVGPLLRRQLYRLVRQEVA